MFQTTLKHLSSSFYGVTILTRHSYNPRRLHHSFEYQSSPDSALPRRATSADSDVAKSNWSITKLNKNGRIFEARDLFDEMRDRDVITWTALITGYVRLGMVEEARKMFDRVDSVKDVVTWTVMVNGYVRSNKIEEAEKLFSEMPEKNVVSWNTMIEGYAKSGKFQLAWDLFQRMPLRNMVSWNTILTALTHDQRMDEATKLFEIMPEKNVISWTIMVSGLSRNGRVDEARRIFECMPVRNTVSWNAMVSGYVKNQRLSEALELFGQTPEKNTCSWNTMITGFVQNGELETGLKLFDEMPNKDSVSWTAIITGYVQNGQSEEALKIFSKMVFYGFTPNEATFATALSACSDLAGLVEGQQVHQMISKTVHKDSAILVSALVNMYSKSGALTFARKMFTEGLTCRTDLVYWNGMISAYAHHGCGLEAVNLFDKLRRLGLKPDDVTYVGLLSACSHAGLLNEGLKYFNDLVNDESIRVREEHYTCYVDLCGRAGKLKQAFDFIERLGKKASTTVWEALLAACNYRNDTCIANLTMEKILDFGSDQAGTYSSLTNMYASSGKWKEAAKVRLEMKEKGLKKQPGVSWIEVGNAVTVFIVGDKSHVESKNLYTLLCDLHEEMKSIGFVSDSDILLEESV